MLTVERLKYLYRYNKDTGIFSRNVPGKRNVGSIKSSDKNQYLYIGIDGRAYSAHRLAWLYTYDKWPKNQIDHINGNGLDNRIQNLRDASNQENSRNNRLNSNNKTGIHGVRWHKRDRLWESLIRIDGKQKLLYRGGDFFQACCARKRANNENGFHENHGRIKQGLISHE